MKEVVDSALKHLEAAKEEIISTLKALDSLIGVLQHISSVLEEYDRREGKN